METSTKPHGESTAAQKLIPETHAKLARRQLGEPDVPALVAYEATKSLLGPGIDSWEPETIIHELERRSITLSDVNLQKLLCVLSLHQNRDVLTNAHVFQKIVLALNGEPVNPQIPEKAEVEQIAWAIVVLKLEGDHAGFGVYFDYEPVEYVARVLHDEGFVLAPKILAFAQEPLSRLNKNPELASEVKAAQAKTSSPSGKLVSLLVKTQLEKLQRVDDYVAIMFDALQDGLKSYR